jgi:branched-chain amino acid transport system substrate-binding protein
LLLALLMMSCTARAQALVVPFTSVRPVAQLGVLAPFEGIERRNGYAALDAVRSAVVAAPPARTGIIPLALDTSLDPARAAAKIAASTNVSAVVGPLTPQAGNLTAPALAEIPWFAPWAVSAQGFVAPQEHGWLEALAVVIGEAAQAQSVQRLLVGGFPSAWEEILREGFGPSATIQFSSMPTGAAQPGDTLIWFGDGAEGAAASAALRAQTPNAPIWLAPWAVDDVYFEHLHAASGNAQTLQEIYSVVWAGPHFAEWTEAHPQGMPSAYLMYEAAVQATAVAADGATLQPAEKAWQPHTVRVGLEGFEVIAPAAP